MGSGCEGPLHFPTGGPRPAQESRQRAELLGRLARERERLRKAHEWELEDLRRRHQEQVGFWADTWGWGG